MSNQILEGVKVLDVSTMIAAPIGASFLAEFGADVIRVESRSNMDTMRISGMNKNGVRLYPKLLNRNKRCITLDFHHQEAQETFYKLVEWADVIITNFRLPALKKFHIDYEDCVKHNPQIIYMHFSAYGRTGPKADKPGYARISEAYAGLTYITGWKDRAPSLSGSWIVDGISGIHIAYSIMLALYHKKCSGEGQLIDLALYDPLWRILDELPANYSVNGVVKERNGNMQSQQVPNNMYKSKDGKWIVLPANGNMFNRLCSAMDRTDLLDDPRYKTMDARVANRELVDNTVAEWIATMDGEDCMKLLDEYGVSNGPVNSIKDLFEDEHMWERGSIIKVFDEELGLEMAEPGVIPQMSKTPGAVKWNGPALGAHNDEIFRDLLGISEEDYQHFQEIGAI